jgi:N-acetylgalactosamine kinase
VVAIRRGGDALVLANLQAAAYPEVSFSVDPAQAVDVGRHTWGNYFLGAYKGVYEHLAARGGAPPPPPVGLQVLVHGRVPTGSGLSSSAAIVCASALAVLGVHGLRLAKGEVAEFAARAEQYVGVTSGGMDQAISIMGMPGIAQHVEFAPVRAADVALPPDAAFVIANSLAVSNKAESATGRYNLRVVECRLAAAALALALGAGRDAAARAATLKEVEPLAEAEYGGGAPNAASAAVAALLHEAPYEAAELEALLGRPLAALFEGDASAARVLAAFSSFKLRQRAAHVYAEKQRVLDFAAACAGAGAAGGVAPAATLAALGALMDASQTSCAQLYECSCPELDALVGVARRAGALGARLTGAGWGGCTVSLVRTADVAAFIAQVRREYYAPLVAAGRVAEADLGATIFASRPASGGAVLRLKL